MTYRASTDWATKLGSTDASTAEVNRRAIHMLVEFRDEVGGDGGPMVISGCIGPRGDGYRRPK